MTPKQCDHCEIVLWAVLSGLGGFLGALKGVDFDGPVQLNAIRDLIVGAGVPFVSTMIVGLRMISKNIGYRDARSASEPSE